MDDKLIRDALLLFATIDPIGTLALFIGLTKGVSSSGKRKIALKAICYSFVILSASLFVGQLLLKAMGIDLVSLQIGGSIILFILGLQMVFGKEDQFMANQPEKDHDLAVFPLAVPSIANPGAIMAVIVTTDYHIHTLSTQLVTWGIMTAILVIAFLILLLANPVYKIIGKNGSMILVKIMGLILSSLSVQLFLDAITAYNRGAL